jgi:hypothetical protein
MYRYQQSSLVFLCSQVSMSSNVSHYLAKQFQRKQNQSQRVLCESSREPWAVSRIHASYSSKRQLPVYQFRPSLKKHFLIISRDRTIYDSSIMTPTNRLCTADPKAILCMGRSFFDSYGTFPSTKYFHGFSLAANNISGFHTLEQLSRLPVRQLGPNSSKYESLAMSLILSAGNGDPQIGMSQNM